MKTVFDLPGSTATDEARLEHHESLGLPLDRVRVLEVGSGVGELTGFFERRTCDILSTEARPTNAASPARLSLFTVPKPFRGHTGTIQRNAIRSWLRLSPRPEVLLLGDEEGTAEIAAQLGLTHLPLIERNERGTPLVSSIFQTAQQYAACELMAYVNTDVILFGDFTEGVALSAEAVDTFLMVGRRYDLDVWEELDLDGAESEEALKERARMEGVLHEPTGIDYFAFRRGLYLDIPPFAIGRTAWDNWLIWCAKIRGAKIIDATRMTCVVHQDHDYNHSKGGVLDVWNGEEARSNRKLAGPNVLTIDAADYALESGGLVAPGAAALLPSPTPEELGRLKVRQAAEALSRGMGPVCSDLLDCAEHLIGQQPRGLNYLRAQLALGEGKLPEAAAALEGELAAFPDHPEAQKTLNFVRLALKKEPSPSPSPAPRAIGRKCLFINTYYDKFLQSQYGTCPDLLRAPYRAQLAALTAACFGDSDFYSKGLARAGWQAEDLVINCTPLQERWGAEHSVALTGWDLVAEQVRRAAPEVIYIQDMNLVPEEFLQRIRPMAQLIAGQIATPVSATLPFRSYDVVFSSMPHYVERLRKGGITAYYQPLAFDPRILDEVATVPYRERPIGCSFVGGISNLHREGNRLLQDLVATVPIELWGYGAEALPSDSPLRAHHHGEAWGKEMFAILAASRITVNRHGEVAETFANNMRLFEATGSGALLITDYKDNLNELFEIGTEVVAFRTPEECAALIAYYLEHADEAAEIARAGQERTLREHTYPLRMAQTAEILERHLRYRREAGTLPALDSSRVSCGYAPIEKSAVTESLTRAWRDPAIPARQRALVQDELARMYRGGKIAPFEVLAEVLTPHLERGMKLLEIGCASGYYYEILEYLLNRRIDYTGVDYSEAMIAMAKDYYPKATFFAADGASLFFEDRAFDIVISSGVLLHVTNYRDHIVESARVAREFIVAARTPVCRKAPTQYLRKSAYGVETVELVFNEEELLREFDLCGFDLLNGTQYVADSGADHYQVTYLLRRR